MLRYCTCIDWRLASVVVAMLEDTEQLMVQMPTGAGFAGSRTSRKEELLSLVSTSGTKLPFLNGTWDQKYVALSPLKRASPTLYN